jgi:hypothetical protein
MAKRKRETDEDIVQEANERYRRAHEYQSAAHRHYNDDLKFVNGDDENGHQWADGVSQARKAGKRPALTVNKTRVHCLQIINDARQNPVQVRINPTGDEATAEAAQIYEGIVRHIEYVSNAQQAYANATYCQVMGGIGYWRVLVDYAHDDTFNQEIYIKRVPDPTAVFMDPDIIQADGSDAKWAFVFYDLTREEYEDSYGKSDASDTADGSSAGDANLNNAALTLDGDQATQSGYRTDDKHVQLVEYFRVSAKPDRLLQMADGSTVRESKLPKDWREALDKFGMPIMAEREIYEPNIEWFLIADNKIIERSDWPGKFVPIVRVPCEEVVIDKKLDWVSHVRHLRDPQRLYNWYTSQAAEFVALQTKSPFVGVAESIEPYIADWENANTENKAILLYKGKDQEGNPIPPPARSQPPVMAQAYMEGLKISQAEMMMASGQYQAVMGEPSNETSGKAINARQRQGDNATYHVIDRLASAIRYTGRIILDLIPRVYDTERAIMIIGEDGTQTQVHVDPAAPQAHQTTLDPNQPPAQPSMNAQEDPDAQRQQALRTIFNPNIGRYAVVADVGPSYATKRQEAFNAMNQVMAQNGEAFAIMGDFWAKNADFPGADELAARLKQGLPPQYKAGAPDPQVVALTQQGQAMQDHAKQLLGQADKEVADLKQQLAVAQAQLKDKSADIAVKDYDAETRRLSAVGGIDPMSLQVIVRGMVQDMLQTELHPVLHAHADVEGALQGRMAQPQEQPPQDPNAMPPDLAQAHNVADLAQKHADILSTHAQTAQALAPPEPAESATE